MTPYEDVPWFWEKLNDYLERNQLKQTKQRQIILEHFLRLNPHVDAEVLFEAVKKDGHNVGLATVYRTLNLLKAVGLVDQNSFADGRAVFELRAPGEHHDHIVCQSCGKIVEFKNFEIEKLQLEVAKNLGFYLASHRLDLFGICFNCTQNSVK